MKTTEIQLERTQIEDGLRRLKSVESLKKVRQYLQTLNVILDKAEAAFERGEYVTNEEAMTIIKSW